MTGKERRAHEAMTSIKLTLLALQRYHEAHISRKLAGEFDALLRALNAEISRISQDAGAAEHARAEEARAAAGGALARAEQRERLSRLFTAWLADDPTSDQETWAQLSAALEPDQRAHRGALEEEEQTDGNPRQ